MRAHSRTNRTPDSTGLWTDPVPVAELNHWPVLARDFYARPTAKVAVGLLGAVILHETPTGARAGRIVEVEAYLGEEDLAAHASRGVTPRTSVIFGPPGHAYVYLIYGMYDCLNLVTEADGRPGCVLIRALEPLAGLEAMRQARPAARHPHELCAGPGRLTRALGITRSHYGADLTRSPLTVRRAPGPPSEPIARSVRIGVRHCADWPLRFYLAGNPSVSSVRPPADTSRT